jgi:hypothetical protein
VGPVKGESRRSETPLDGDHTTLQSSHAECRYSAALSTEERARDAKPTEPNRLCLGPERRIAVDAGCRNGALRIDAKRTGRSVRLVASSIRAVAAFPAEGHRFDHASISARSTETCGS